MYTLSRRAFLKGLTTARKIVLTTANAGESSLSHENRVFLGVLNQKLQIHFGTIHSSCMNSKNYSTIVPPQSRFYHGSKRTGATTDSDSGTVVTGERIPAVGAEEALSTSSAWIDKEKFQEGFNKEHKPHYSHGIWLRDHCRCPECFHTTTKQRLLDTSSIPLDIVPSQAQISKDGKELHVTWSSPEHNSVYALSWLREHSYAPRLGVGLHRPRAHLRLWGSSFSKSLPITPYKDIISSDTGLAHWLSHIDTFGIGFVDGVPPTPEATEELSRRVSFIRETHYGTFWDFSPNLEHGDTAYTSIALPAHTDSTYFTDPVGLQFFHVLQHDGTGGESLYVDGFNVALQLQQKSPWAFDILSSIRVPAHSAGDSGTLIQPSPNGFPIINIDPLTQELYQIRFNNDDRSILSHLSSHQIKSFYAALKEWTILLRSKQNEMWVKLRPGLAVMVDNWRVLHGRASFTGYRRVCGSYHSWDDYRSKFKLLCEKNAKERF